MQKIVPFKKEVKFKDEVSEVTSISLEHTTSKNENNIITGNFIISGEYKIEATTIIEPFNFEIPFDINVDEKYDIKESVIEIDDFYYEIINNNKLMINIDILIDKLNENKIVPIQKEIYNIVKEVDDRDTKEEEKETVEIDNKENDYSIYKVYIVKEEDTLDMILDKYNITVEQLEKYNDLTNITKGTKIIIPSI